MTSYRFQESAWEEGVALSLLRELDDPVPPMNAFTLADACGLRIEPASAPDAKLVGDVIYLNTRIRPQRQHGRISHELGHWAQRRAGLPDTEAGASYVGAAAMLPRRHLDRDLRETAWDLRGLRARHPNCSAEFIARRIATMRDACVAIWDNGRLKIRIVSPWLPEGFHKMSHFERDLARAVLESGETIQAGPLLWGFAVFEGSWRRVITICEAEELTPRYQWDGPFTPRGFPCPATSCASALSRASDARR